MSQEEKHLFGAGWNPDKEKHEDFSSRRPVDYRDERESALRKALESSGYRNREKREQIMESARAPSMETSHWKREKVEAGSKFYALTTVTDDGRGIKSAESAYWLDEAQVKRLEREGLIDLKEKRIEAAELKNRLALPCHNRVNGMVEARVTQDHDAIRTTVGKGKDIYSVGNEERSRWMDGGEEQWHPKLNALDLDRSINRQKLAEWDGQVADYRSFHINYSPADRQNQQAARQPASQHRRFGEAVEACEKALAESRRKQDYDPAARIEYAKRKAEMEGHVTSASQNPALLGEIRDEKVRKSLQDRVVDRQRQADSGSRQRGQQPEAH